MQYHSWFDSPDHSSSAFDINSHILCHTMNMSRLEAAPIVLLQSTTSSLPRPEGKHSPNSPSNSPTMANARIYINNHAFSRYECEIACAIQLFIRNANNKVPTDETLGFIIKALRGEINGESLPCQSMVSMIERYDTESVRSIYLSVCLPFSVRYVPKVHTPFRFTAIEIIGPLRQGKYGLHGWHRMMPLCKGH